MEDLKNLLNEGLNVQESIDTDNSYNGRGPLAAIVDDNSGTVGVLIGGTWTQNDNAGRKKAQRLVQALGLTINIDFEDYAVENMERNSEFCYIVSNGDTVANVDMLGDSIHILNEI